MIKFLKYLLIVLLLIILSQGNSFVYPVRDWMYIVILGVALLIKPNCSLLGEKPIFVTLCIILSFVIYYYIFYGIFSYSLLVLFICIMLVSNAIYKDFLKYFTQIIVIYAYISIPFIIATCFFFDETFHFMKVVSSFLGMNSSFGFDNQYYANVFVFTINQSTSSFRNCGFMWEPSPYASILSIALFYQLFKDKMIIKPSSIILSLSIILTFSTTGYLSLMTIILFFVTNKRCKLSIKVISILFFCVISFFIMSLPFMYEKINRLTVIDKDVLNYQSNSYRTVSLGRFNGIILDLEDLRKSPLFGIGNYKNSVGFSNNIVSINGLSTCLGRYGIIGLCLFLFALWRSSLVIFCKKTYYVFFIILILIHSFSLTVNLSLFYQTIIFGSFYCGCWNKKILKYYFIQKTHYLK